ncbi:MAG: DJ-1 family glyoxalase III [Anaerovoracaceae bacterium]|jgi:4-methyl-5(b-hydroxyethyl)-thiazole monophosphate biosynthesis
MVYVHLATGFEEVEAASIVDMLRRGNVETALVSVTGEEVVSGAHDIRFTADLLFEDADYDSCEMIVLPGGMPGTTNLQEHDGLCDKIKEFAEAGKWTCAVCAAPMVLASCGILKGRKATIYPGMEKYIEGAQHTEGPVVKDGTIITSQAPGTAMLFGLELVAALKGEEAKEAVRSELFMAI